MKKALVVVLVCAASVFAAWDYFPVIEHGKGEAKIAHYQSRRVYSSSSGYDFKLRYSPMVNLEVMSKLGYTLGARYQIMPVLSAGLDIGLPIPSPVWGFTPNVQFSMPLTEALTLGSNAEITITSENPQNEYTDVAYFKVGGELDLNMGQNIVWFGLDFNTGLGKDSNKNKASDTGKGLKTSPAVGYRVNVGNMTLGTNASMDFGKKSGNDPHNTTIGLDVALKF